MAWLKSFKGNTNTKTKTKIEFNKINKKKGFYVKKYKKNNISYISYILLII